MSVKKKIKRTSDYSLADVYEDDYKNKDKGGGGNKPNYLDLSDWPDLEWYKVKKNKNKIGIIQYRIATDHHPKGREKGKTDYKLAVFVHRFFGDSEGNYLCMKETFGEPCPGCKEVKKMIASKEYTYKDQEVKNLKSQLREIFIIQDLMEDDDKIYLFDISHWEFLKEVLAEAERDTDGDGVIPFADLEDGKAIIFYGEEREGEFKNTTYKPTGFRFRDREPIDPEMIDEVPSLDELLVFPDYEEMEKDLYGISSKEEDDEEEEKPKKKSKKPADDEDEDKDPEETNDEEEEEDLDDNFKRAVDNDDDEDEDDDEPEPPKKKKARKIEEDEDDDEPEKPSTKKRTRGGKEKTSSKKTDKKQKCPHGHKFGEDCDEYPKDCKKCELWDACSDAYGQD